MYATLREAVTVEAKALAKQVGGNHYKKYKIQPIEFCQVNELNQCESNVIKYICRWRDKDGIKDLRKAIHMIELLIEIEGLETKKESPNEKHYSFDPSGTLTINWPPNTFYGSDHYTIVRE